MSYTLDIEVDPADQVLDPSKPVTPLFRRSFTTSKFESVTALANDVRASQIKHRALDSQIAGLGGAGVVTATDQEIQDALVAAGEQALPAAAETGITVYWAKRHGAATFSPHAILIDASEPVWRTRSEPVLETMPDQEPPADPTFMRVVPRDVAALEVVETGSHAVQRFIRSPGGTRTLAILSDAFNPPAEGALVTLSLHQPKSDLYTINDHAVTLTSMRLDAQAPWDDDNA